MPAKEIKELRQVGNLEEALNLAKAELQDEPLNIWSKRNISWVYYDYLKQNCSPENFDVFISWLNEIKYLELPDEEKMFYEQLCWQIGKMAFSLIKINPQDHYKCIRLFESIKTFHFPKPSDCYSFLFKTFHKSLKDTDFYIQFSDWWDFQYFMPQDFQKEKMSNGKELMALAEQAHIAYAKHLLPKYLKEGGIYSGEVSFDPEKVKVFIKKLNALSESYPKFQYPAYFQAKLLLSLGDNSNVLDKLLPFAKKKQNDFWVWQILAEVFTDQPDKEFACYCKALTCKSPEEMLVSLRQKVARILISQKHYNEAKTEILLLLRARAEHNFKIPTEVLSWQASDWYESAKSSTSNMEFYKAHVSVAEDILFNNVPEELVIVEFVNTDKKVLNFIASETKFGFFKYDRFLPSVRIGDILKVRFQGGTNGGVHQVYTVVKTFDQIFKSQFMKEVSGKIKIPQGKSFGFIDDVFVHPSLLAKYNLINGQEFSGSSIKTYNKDKKEWSWKII